MFIQCSSWQRIYLERHHGKRPAGSAKMMQSAHRHSDEILQQDRCSVLLRQESQHPAHVLPWYTYYKTQYRHSHQGTAECYKSRAREAVGLCTGIKVSKDADTTVSQTRDTGALTSYN